MFITFAFTTLSLAETEQTEAVEINKQLPLKLARIAARNKQILIHISTD